MIHFDCHAHVYEKMSAIPGARYVPKKPAPLATWEKHLESHDLMGGVIVQVSFLGTDNSELCAALGKLDRRRFAGVGVVAPDVDDDELDRLVTAGIRGIRWNLVRGAEIPNLTSPLVQTFFQKLRQRNLHLEVHLEGPRLAPHLEELCDLGINLVIDHFGLPSETAPEDDPLISAVNALSDRSRLYFKFSAHYRTKFDLRPHANALLNVLQDRHVVWGSDWPHTQHDAHVRYAQNHGAVIPADGVSDTMAAKTLYGIVAS